MSVTVPQLDSPSPDDGFTLHLDNFDGPFDLLLQLISRHQLDITDVALSKVTDEFITHVKTQGTGWELEQTTAFLVVASTLLDLKIVRLLPSADVEDEGDLALLEARDLLFARLLQYRAFKQVAAHLEASMLREARHVPRSVSLEEPLARLLPEVLLALTPDQLAALAARALAPRAAEQELHLEHLHAPRVSVREQAALLVERLRRTPSATFRGLVADAPDTATTVARFLALLELFREGAVSFEQASALGELSIRWTGPQDVEYDVADEYDETPDAEAVDAEAVDAEAVDAEAVDAEAAEAAVDAGAPDA